MSEDVTVPEIEWTSSTYSTVRALTFVLPSGTTIDTAAPDAAERFAAAEPELVAVPADYKDPLPFAFSKGDTIAILGNGKALRSALDAPAGTELTITVAGGRIGAVSAGEVAPKKSPTTKN